MRKRRETQAMTRREFQLPEPMIQHIQSFLSAKQAAQTTVLSKSWNEAWLTRPNLDLVERDFPRNLNYGQKGGFYFWEFAKKTIQRYEKLNLQIESLKLYLGNEYCDTGPGWDGYCDFYLVKELIVKSLKMGATHISLRITDPEFVLPCDVFGAENLVGLSFEGGGTIELGQMEIRCSRLKTLSLDGVWIERFDKIPNLIASFPLIEKLSLTNISDDPFSDQVPLKLGKMQNLRCLVLSFVDNTDPLFFADLSSKLPSLKDLTLRLDDDAGSLDHMLFSSRSLEHLSFEVSFGFEGAYENFRVTFDLPSIRVFKFEGSAISSFSFKSTPSREWESHLSITRGQKLSMSWFLRLNRLLLELVPSKIHLSLCVYSKRSFDYEVEHIEGLRKPVLENLTVDTPGLPPLTCYALFDALFWLCRPKIITRYVPRESGFREDFLYKTLVPGMDGKSSCGLRGLKKVRVRVFDMDVLVWRDLQSSEFLIALASRKYKQKTCFHLRWIP